MKKIWIFVTFLLVAVATSPANADNHSFLSGLAKLFGSQPSLENIPQLRRLAKEGNQQAQFMLYTGYKSMGRDNVGPHQANDRLLSRKEAEAGLRAAAEQGYRDAMLILGAALHGGDSLKRDSRAAIPWLDKIYADEPASGRAALAFVLGDALLSADGATAGELERGLTLVDEALAGGVSLAVRVRARAMARRGDEAGARIYLATALDKGNKLARAPLGRMLIDGTGGPAELSRGLELLHAALKDNDDAAGFELGREHLDGGHLPRNPRKALTLMAPYAGSDFSTRQRLAELLSVYWSRLPNAGHLFFRMKEDELVGEPGAAWRLLRLLDTKTQHFRDDKYIYDLVKRHKRSDKRIELYDARINARFSLHGNSSGMFAELAEQTIEKLVAQNMATAFTLKGQLQRKGTVYPQDDVAATQALQKGAELGDEVAMLGLAKAYDEGRGIAKNPGAKLEWLRKAAARGSIDAKKALVWNFAFSKQVTLREGLTELVVLYGDGLGGFIMPFDIAKVFHLVKFRDVSEAEVIVAFMDGFRAAPAALDDDKLLPLQSKVPKEVWAKVEAVLMAAGHFKGPAQGYFGPKARAALAKWAAAEGPLRTSGTVQ